MVNKNGSLLFVLAKQEKVVFFVPSFVGFLIVLIPMVSYLENIFLLVLSVLFSSFFGIIINEFFYRKSKKQG